MNCRTCSCSSGDISPSARSAAPATCKQAAVPQVDAAGVDHNADAGQNLCGGLRVQAAPAVASYRWGSRWWRWGGLQCGARLCEVTGDLPGPV
jgi:hypothetical protein